MQLLWAALVLSGTLMAVEGRSCICSISRLNVRLEGIYRYVHIRIIYSLFLHVYKCAINKPSRGMI